MKVELYKIYDEFNEYYYTSSNENVLIENTNTEIDNILFIAKPIERGEIEIDNIEKDNFKFNAPISMQPLDQFVVYNPDRIFWLKIFNEDGIILYIGQINDISYNIDKHSVDVNCKNIANIFANNIPKCTFGPNCNFNLFDSDCALNKENYKVILDNTNYTILDSNTITINYEDGYFSSGTLHIRNQINFIKAHKNNTLYLMYPIKEQNFNEDIILYPGCNKTLSTCRNKYDNEENYGGYPFVPLSNPYEKF